VEYAERVQVLIAYRLAQARILRLDCKPRRQFLIRHARNLPEDPAGDEPGRDEAQLTVYTAGKLAPYQDPQLATVKVGGDRANPLIVREGVTSKRIMEELRRKILETGLLPSDMVDVTPNKVEGVDGKA
jgi:hypothetical protein